MGEWFSPEAAEVDRRIMAAEPPKAALTPEAFYQHFLRFGPDRLEDAARGCLTADELLKLANRVNDVIDRASKRRQDGEPRDVVSYRARLSEARARGSQRLWLQRLTAKSEGGVDPRVGLCLELHAAGERTSIIASRTGRSPDWVRKTVRDSVSQVSQAA